MRQFFVSLRTTTLGVLGALAVMCGVGTTAATAQTATELRIGVQFGLGYLPFHVAEQAGFFAARMREQGLTPIPVRIVQLAGAPQMNDGLLSGTLQLASGGYTAMMLFCEKTRKLGQQQFLGVTALASVPYNLFTVDPALKSLKDIDAARDKIGVPSIKVSVPAVYLQMAAEQLYGRGQQNKFDVATVSLAQPDGAISLLSGGGAVNSYLFSPPFIQELTGKPKIHQVWSSNELFGSTATALVSWTTVKFHNDNPKLFAAIIAAMRDSMRLIADDPKRAAQIYLAAERSKVPPALIEAALADKSSLRYSVAPEQTLKIADFLQRTGGLKAAPKSWKTFFFSDIHGEQGS